MKIAPLRDSGPWGIRAALVAFAIGGSCLFGASLSLVLPGWATSATAVWFAGSAGLAWGIFIPVLSQCWRIPFTRALHTSLVAMAGGEVVLCSGAVVNLTLAAIHGTGSAGAAWVPVFNVGTIVISNVAMFLLLGMQLCPGRPAPPRLFALWMLVLNGSGALFFAVLFHCFLRP